MTVTPLRWYRFGCDHCRATTHAVCGATLTEAVAQVVTPWDISVVQRESAPSGHGGIILAAHEEIDTVTCPQCQSPSGEQTP